MTVVEHGVHRSWKQVSETRWVQKYGFQDAFYGRILAEVGTPALFMVNCQVKFTFKSHTNDVEVVAQLRNAWKAMRLAYPILATVSQQDQRVYDAVTSYDELETWAQETFKVDPTLSGSDLWQQLVKTRLPTLYYLPKTSELSLQAEHSHLDGRGLLRFWNEFISFLVNPAPLVLGRELANLPGTSDDYLQVQEEFPGQGRDIALELLRSLDVSPPETAVSYPLKDPSTLTLAQPGFINGRARHKFPPKDAARIIAACRSHSISLTAAFHAAVGFATQDVQRQRGVEPGSKFAAFSNLDLRRYFQHDGHGSAPSAAKTLLGNFHTILPCVSHYGHGASFVDVAEELSASYRDDLAARPGLFSALRPMMEHVGDGFTAGPLLDTTPAISTGGNLDLVLRESYLGPAGAFTIDDLWAGDVVTGPWMDCFISIFQGGMTLSSVFNGVFYPEDEACNFLVSVGDHMLGGLGLEKRPHAKI
ncbi:hypothetical protein NLU13_1029 [Sarocladium strictum]|uniref:Uncharacterized protein n=1 Tax=Sarocladium strictum TaxID=5046 RepID=A0AA39GQX1_SARSR|nr:hypothetical protein NLU13_1029 [Sarocladium strictum]